MVGSGALHATVNAIFKAGGPDKMSGRALIDGSSALLVLPLAMVVPLPSGAWLCLAGSMAVHLFYLQCLIRAYAMADMSAVYPVMRGSAPVIAAIAATVVLGDAVTPVIALAIGAVVIGTLLVAARNTPPLHTLGWAMASGAAIAAFTVVDAKGVRAAPTTMSYVVWDFIATGAGIGGFYAWWRGGDFIVAARSQWRAGLVAGALSVVTYGLALAAYKLGNVARLAALRETSIVFGLVIASVFLRERVNHTRAAGGVMIALGAGVMILLG